MPSLLGLEKQFPAGKQVCHCSPSPKGPPCTASRPVPPRRGSPGHLMGDGCNLEEKGAANNKIQGLDFPGTWRVCGWRPWWCVFFVNAYISSSSPVPVGVVWCRSITTTANTTHTQQ